MVKSTSPRGGHHPEDVVVDSLGGWVWVASEHSLKRYNVADLSDAPLAINLPTVGSGSDDDDEDSDSEIEALAFDPVSGTLWVGGEHSLFAYSRDGALVWKRDISIDGLDELEDIRWDPVNTTLWVDSEQILAAYQADGTQRAQLTLDKKLRALATAPFIIKPTIELIAPLNGVYTNDPGTAIDLRLGVECNSTGCDALGMYLNSFAIQATLDDNTIGNGFKIGRASCRERV